MLVIHCVLKHRFHYTVKSLSKDISPLEAGIGFAVKLKKEQDFHGKDALVAQKENGVPRKSIGIEMIDKGIPRTAYPVYVGDKQIGEVTTGTQSPTLKEKYRSCTN